MKKFKVKVVREDEYEIEIDENVWTQENMDDFSKVFYKVDDIIDVAEIVAEMFFDQGEGSFLEGFGILRVKGMTPLWVYGDNEKSVCKDINMASIESDIYIEDIEELI